MKRKRTLRNNFYVTIICDNHRSSILIVRLKVSIRVFRDICRDVVNHSFVQSLIRIRWKYDGFHTKMRCATLGRETEWWRGGGGERETTMLSKDKTRIEWASVSQGLQGRETNSRPLLSPWSCRNKCGGDTWSCKKKRIYNQNGREDTDRKSYGW